MLFGREGQADLAACRWRSQWAAVKPKTERSGTKIEMVWHLWESNSRSPFFLQFFLACRFPSKDNDAFFIAVYNCWFTTTWTWTVWTIHKCQCRKELLYLFKQRSVFLNISLQSFFPRGGTGAHCRLHKPGGLLKLLF